MAARAVGAPERRASRAPVYVTLGFFALAITLVLIGATRSGEHPTIAPLGASPGTAANPRPVTVIMRDYLFEPVPLALYPGETIRVTAFNAGLEPHELVLGGPMVQEAWTRADAAATPPGPFATAAPASAASTVGGLRLLVRSGDQASANWTIPAGDALLLQCHLPGHLERGMSATVTLVPPGPSSTPGQ